MSHASINTHCISRLLHSACALVEITRLPFSIVTQDCLHTHCLTCSYRTCAIVATAFFLSVVHLLHVVYELARLLVAIMFFLCRRAVVTTETLLVYHESESSHADLFAIVLFTVAFASAVASKHDTSLTDTLEPVAMFMGPQAALGLLAYLALKRQLWETGSGEALQAGNTAATTASPAAATPVCANGGCRAKAAARERASGSRAKNTVVVDTPTDNSNDNNNDNCNGNNNNDSNFDDDAGLFSDGDDSSARSNKIQTNKQKKAKKLSSKKKKSSKEQDDDEVSVRHETVPSSSLPTQPHVGQPLASLTLSFVSRLGCLVRQLRSFVLLLCFVCVCVSVTAIISKAIQRNTRQHTLPLLCATPLKMCCPHINSWRINFRLQPP